MTSSSSQEQLPTAQVGALNTICQQFADSDKKTLKLKVKRVKRRETELDKRVASDHHWNMEMKPLFVMKTWGGFMALKKCLRKAKKQD